LWRIGLTGWEIFSKLDAVKWTLNQAEEISQRVFRLLKGPSIPESNQRGKRNKNHMNPLIQLKKAKPLFVIAFVLACFALSPQAFAGTVATPTFTSVYNSACHRYELRVSTTTSGATIYVWDSATVGISCLESCTIPVTQGGSSTIYAQGRKLGWINSVTARTTYTDPGACH
jgi:hypothetical protein